MKSKHLLKRPLFWVILGLVVIIVIIAVSFLVRGRKMTPDTLVVETVDLIQEVSVTGKVVPADSVTLAFESGGRVAAVNADVGDSVYAGEIITRTDGSEAYAKLLQAEADYQTAQAKLSSLKKGSRPEQIAIDEVKVDNAKVALVDAKKSLLAAYIDAYTKADDAIRSKIDQFITDGRSNNPQLSVPADPQLKIDIEAGRIEIETGLTAWKQIVDKMTVDTSTDTLVDKTPLKLDTLSTFLDNVSLVINKLTAASNLSQTTIATYKADTLTARNNVNLAITNLNSAIEKVSVANANLAVAQNELVLTKAGSTPDDLLAEEAKVKSAEANVLNYQSLYNKTFIKAPFSGVITKQDAKIGQIAPAGSGLVALIGKNLEIEAFVPEADIAKLKVGDSADVTLDAYGSGVVFKSKVISIDPAETEIESVSTYKAKFQFLETDPRIKSGMTANIDVITARRESALAIPQRSIYASNGETTVKVVVAGEIVERKIVTGIRSNDGKIEVVSGLQDGDVIVSNPK